MPKEKQLYRVLFLVSVLLLLFNDLYLKFAFHNYLTGKLSDFAGLFAFPYFFSCFFPKKIKPIYFFTGILFIFWKSEFSQPMFDLAHSFGIGINRTIDYSDLMALFILPFSYQYWQLKPLPKTEPKSLFKSIVIVISSFSFIATSLPAHYEEVNMKSDFETTLPYDLETVKGKLRIFHDSTVPIGSFTINLEDRKTEIWTKISLRKVDRTTTKVVLDSIMDFRVQGTGFLFYNGIDDEDVEYIQKLTKNDLEKLFEKSLQKEFEKIIK